MYRCFSTGTYGNPLYESDHLGFICVEYIPSSPEFPFIAWLFSNAPQMVLSLKLSFLLVIVWQALLSALGLIQRLRKVYLRHSRNMSPLTHSVIEKLPADIFVDNITTFLDVEDVLVLRRVNKHYRAATRHPAIWKRFLCRSAFSLPPLPPSYKYSLGSLMAFEAESFAIRQASFLRNLRTPSPRLFASRTLESTRQVSFISIVPGGKHLVTSTCSRDGGNTRYFLEIWDLDRVVQGERVSPHCIQTNTRPYGLKTNYMILNGTPGIVIAYIRSEIQEDNVPALYFDPSDFSEGNTPLESAKLMHFCHAIHIPLLSLDGTSSPFRVVAMLRSPFKLRGITLNHVAGRPLMAVVRQKRNIDFWDLDEQRLFSTLQCEIEPEECQIVEHIVLLPHQYQVLVVCLCPHSPAHNHSIALYDIPSEGEEALSYYTSGFVMDASNIPSHNIVLSDFHYPSPHDPSIHADLARHNPPLPLTIHFREDNRFCCLSIVPRKMLTSITSSPTSPFNSDNTEYHVYLEKDVFRLSHHQKLFHSAQARMLPASCYPLGYSISQGDNKALPSFQFFINNLSLLRRKGGENASSEDLDVNRLSVLYPCIPEMLLNGLAGQDDCLIAWDESIGRACVITGGSRLYVLDYGYTPKAPLDSIKSLFD